MSEKPSFSADWCRAAQCRRIANRSDRPMQPMDAVRVFLVCLLLATFAPTLARAEGPCEDAKAVPKGYKVVATGVISATSSFREVVQAGQAVYVEIENQNVLPGPVELRIRSGKRADGNGGRETVCATNLSVLPKTTAFLWTAIFGETIEYEVDAQLAPGADAGPLTVKVHVQKP